jgi:hypothetical protein
MMGIRATATVLVPAVLVPRVPEVSVLCEWGDVSITATSNMTAGRSPAQILLSSWRRGQHTVIDPNRPTTRNSREQLF